jgi:SAM-dependent methyltransferase
MREKKDKEEINKEYWINFYINNEVSTEESKFASFVGSFLSDKKIDSIIDIGCGNGRDSEYFSKSYNVTGIDLSPPQTDSRVKYIKSNFSDAIFSGYDAYYMRFFVHSITEDEFDFLLSKLSGQMNSNSYLFIETRSIKGIGNGDVLETNFRSSIGEPHYRIHYSFDYLIRKLDSFGFDVIYKLEDMNLAIYKEDNPYVIRIICRRNDL